MRTILLLLALLVSVQTEAQQKILFVGNSLTYYNDLPETVKKIARQNHHKIMVESFAKPNYSLEDHWNEGKVSQAIKKNHYDVVIFQQGPSALRSSRENLVAYAVFFAKLCKEYNSQSAFYMVWPSGDRYSDFENVIYSYTSAADTTDSILCPAGTAWLNAFSAKKDFPLYTTDGFHPSEYGSLLSAMVIYGALFNKIDFDFMLKDKLIGKKVDHDDWFALKSAAVTALKGK